MLKIVVDNEDIDNIEEALSLVNRVDRQIIYGATVESKPPVYNHETPCMHQ